MAFANTTASVAIRRGFNHHHADHISYGNHSRGDNLNNPRANASAMTGKVPPHGQRHANMPKVVVKIPTIFSVAALLLSVLLLLSLTSWWTMMTLTLPQPLSSSSILGRFV